MPSELLNRLQPYLRADKARIVMDAQSRPVAGPAPHWPTGGRANFGQTMDAVHSIMIHGTSGWPTYESANNMVNQYLCRVAQKQGEGPTILVDTSGTAFQLIDMDPPRVTLHAGFMNGISFGIENCDMGDDTDVRPQATNRVYWRKLTALADGSDDLSGLELRAVLHPQWGDGPDLTLLWFPTARYSGPGDITHAGDFRSLFTERDYRTLALVCRFALESMNVPRNFTLLPYEDRSGNATNVSTLRKFVLADERVDMMIRMFGRTKAEFLSNAATLATWYTGRITTVVRRGHNVSINRAWTDFFAEPGAATAASKRCFRGFLSHVMPGSIDANDDHNCPGAYFDWHRLAREVWDWWWYPFDFDADIDAGAVPATTVRPYRQARKDTPLLEYYFDAPASDINFNAVRAPATGTPSVVSDEFNIDRPTPIYALSNGVLVAARIPNETVSPGQVGFVLCRHEVFYRTQVLSHGGAEFNLSSIDYDQAPSFVYSLVTFLKNPAVDFDDVSANNPDWLNRVIIRLFECNKAIEFKRANPADAVFAQAWAHDPIPANTTHRWAAGAQVERDADAYQTLIDDLRAVRTATFPLETTLGATTVRQILGDYLGVPGRPGTSGVGISIFSRDELPVPGRAQDTHADLTQDWWQAAVDTTRLEDDPAKQLPDNRIVWRYPMLNFLSWVNNITWSAEWLKYRVVDAAGNAVVRPDKPRPRRGL